MRAAPMNDNDKLRFDQLYEKLEACPRVETLQELRDFASTLDDAWDRAELIYHEVLFLLDMEMPLEARQRVGDLGRAIAALTEPPSDSYEIDVQINLPVMARYAEARVAFDAGKQTEALRLVTELASTYPKQLSVPEFATIRDVTRTMEGILLAESGHWARARETLEGTNPPDAWRSVHLAYLGQCYYRSREYERAKGSLCEALVHKTTRDWEGKIRFVLGLTELRLSNKESALQQFELSAQMVDAEYLRTAKILEWLEVTSSDLGLFDEAERYRKLRTDSEGHRMN